MTKAREAVVSRYIASLPANEQAKWHRTPRKEFPMTKEQTIEAMALAIERADNVEIPDGFGDAYEHEELSDWGVYLATAAYTIVQAKVEALEEAAGTVNNAWLQWKADELTAEEALNAIFDEIVRPAALTHKDTTA